MEPFSTRHTRTTISPQSYWEHATFATRSSLILLWASLVGLFHAVFPEIRWAQFYTSTRIIRAYKSLEISQRHDIEISTIFSLSRAEYVQQNRGK